MNVKFKMPHFGRKLKGRDMMKEILMTVIGTSISIVLTFGTAHWLEQRQKAKAGRQMAMMVISDIEENVQAFIARADQEEQFYEMAKYVENHLDQLGDISEDTIYAVWNYFSEGNTIPIDDSKENIFNSSPETWKNIDNAQFINIVQKFYLERRYYYDFIKKESAFRAPISLDDEYSMITSRNTLETEDVAAMLSQLMANRKARLYLDYSAQRRRMFNATAQRWQQMSDQGKFIMDITDEELQDYLNKQSRTGNSVSERQLLGKWSVKSSIGDEMETIEFKKDRTFIHIFESYNPSPLFVGKVIFRHIMEGTWKMVGDSLYRDYSTEQYKLDRNGITCAEEMKDSVEHVIARREAEMAKRNETAKREGSAMGKRSSAVFIDHSGNKVEMSKNFVNDKGEEETMCNYMVRQ